MEKRIVRKRNVHFEGTRSNTPKYLRSRELRRFKLALGNREYIARRGTLTQFHQRVAIGRTRICKDKQYMQRIGRRTISLAKSLCEKSTGYIKKTLFRYDLREAQMVYIDLAQLVRIHTKASSKIRRLGRSVSETHASGNREAFTYSD